MEVNCHGKMFYNIGPWWQTYIHWVIYKGILALENVATAVNYYGIFKHWDHLACKGWESINNPHMFNAYTDIRLLMSKNLVCLVTLLAPQN